MSLGDVATLNTYLATRSYITGYTATADDAVVFAAIGSAPDAAKYVHAARWFRHIASKDASSLSGAKKSLADLSAAATAAAPAATPAAAAAADAEDDFDLFGDDDEEAAAEAEKVKEERIAAYKAKKAAKPTLIAKSNIILDVKPWGDDTDLVEMERLVRTIERDGLLWGVAKLKEIGYGIKKLVIAAVVEDDKVGTDFLEEEITKFEDYVQSVDVAAFQKV